jgi:YfiH family protein
MTNFPHDRAVIYPNFGISGLISGTTFITGKDDNFALHTAESEVQYASVKTSRDSFAFQLGFDHLVTLKQVHGETIHRITGDNFADYETNPLIEGDGLITDSKGVLIGILTADCVPVFFISACGVIGIAHAGWKGIFAGIHIRMLEIFRKEYSIGPGEIFIRFGPNIRSCCYEVGKELIDKFIDNGKNPVYNQRDGRIYFDLEGTISAELVSNGVNPERIETPALCTFDCTKPRFFSYRRGENVSRSFSFIGKLDK